MTLVKKVRFDTVNQANFTSQQAENKESKTDIKKYFTAANVILGSLAAVGVLGMADILICKGKHINKLTGKGKELKNALGRASESETKLSQLEASSAETIKKLNAKLKELEKTVGNIPSEKKLDLEILQYFQKLYAKQKRDLSPKALSALEDIEDVLARFGYKLVDFTPGLTDCFVASNANVANIATTVPAIIDNITGKLVLQGRVVFPL